MTKMLKYLPILAIAILTGCEGSQPDGADVSDSLTLVLNITESSAQSRAGEVMTTSEQINSLRVIITRPDGTVESSRLVHPDGNVIKYDDLRFKVRKDQYKMVYLIANEYAVNGLSIGNPTYISPDALTSPSAYTGHLLDTTVSSLPTTQYEPMTAVYRLSTDLRYAQWHGSEYVINYSLKLMRAVTKFTFNIYNNRQTPIDITQIGVDGIRAEKYHLFPRVTSTDGTEVAHYLTLDGPDLITESGSGQMPLPGDQHGADSPFSEYFRNSFSAADIGDGMHTFVGQSTVLPPSSQPVTLEYYYYESGLADDAAASPYTLYIGFDGSVYSQRLENLPALPRNTHVVVNLTFSNNDKVLDIETLPYYGVDLTPSFGQQ